MSSKKKWSGSPGSHNAPSSFGLQRRLLEVAVVVGMDEETGLEERLLEVT